MSLSMSQTSKKEVIAKMRERYSGRGREGRSRLIDELCELVGYSRKHAIKVLGKKLPIGGMVPRRGGPRRSYGAAEAEVLEAIWLASEQPCGKRLKIAVPLWLTHYENESGVLEAGLRERVLAQSAATIDRLLAPCRIALGSRRRCGTRPGTLLRKEIPVRTDHWDVEGPGWIEADTVAHCGESMSGDFCWSLTMTDVHTQWTETRAVWNKGQHGVRAAIADVEATLAFAILGFDSDNGGEFLNWHLADYFLKRDTPVAFTRSRPYHKTRRTENLDPRPAIGRLLAFGKCRPSAAPGRSLRQGVECLSELFLSRHEASAHRSRRQPQATHLRHPDDAF